MVNSKQAIIDKSVILMMQLTAIGRVLNFHRQII